MTFLEKKLRYPVFLTGQDSYGSAKGKRTGRKYLLLPCNLLRSGEEVFLDD